MISNEDPEGKKAFNHILGCSVIQCIMPLFMVHGGMIYSPLILPYYYYMTSAIKEVFRYQGIELVPMGGGGGGGGLSAAGAGTGTVV